MQARKESSKTHVSSPLPLDFTRLAEEAMRELFPLDGHGVSVSGRFYAEELFVRVGITKPGERLPYNFEGSLDFDREKDVVRVMDLLHELTDNVSRVVAEYLEAGEDGLALPLQWTHYAGAEIEGRPVYLQTSRVDTALEEEADRILAENGFLSDGTDDTSIDPFDRARIEAMAKAEEETRH